MDKLQAPGTGGAGTTDGGGASGAAWGASACPICASNTLVNTLRSCVSIPWLFTDLETRGLARVRPDRMVKW